MKPILLVIILIIVSLACNKGNVNAGDVVEIYLLKDFQPVSNKCQVDAAASSLQSLPTISNAEIREYSVSDYQFKLTSTGIEKIKALKDRTPFAVTVGGKIIYYGFFKPSISSSSCDHSITMDIVWGQGNKILMRLGYPGMMQGTAIDDQRNNPTLLTALQKQGKLR